ncbi:MAG: alpha/beta hydrolase [Gammaproteobacteria bacterium]|nr:alpha/beta hydrolase [Gammaproteobacteria bacterium]
MNAVDLHYQIDGRGPPLYLIHGIGARHSAWDGIVPGLTAHFTCVRFDLRGHGNSAAPPPPYSLAQLVDDVEALRRRLGHAAIHIAGHSLGGMIAPAYARRHPKRARSAALISTAAFRTADDRARLQSLGETMRAHGVESALDAFVARWFTDAFIQAEPAVIDARIRQIIDTPPAVFREVFRLYAQTEMAAWLGEVGCPCLALTGALDGGCPPRLNRAIARALPNAELVILDNLKHAVLLESPARVLAPLKRFLLSQDE